MVEHKYSTILLVHVDDSFTTKFTHYFEDKGFTIVQVDNMDQGYQILGAQSVDLVIVDADENYDAAFKFCYRIKHNKNLSRMFVVMLSAAEERFGVLLRAETKDEKKWLNVDLFVNKPISPKSLYLLIKKEIAILEGIDATELDSEVDF
jgi:DNA-binding response OmpR family regulator